ncbi:hypothetical protein [Streptomyces sp. NPDC003635]
MLWAVAVAVAGGLTLWLQDTGEPQGPYQWQEAEHDPADAHDPVHDDSDCPGPDETPSPRPDGTVVLCAYSTAR